MNNKKVENLLWIIFLVIGVIFMLVGVAVSKLESIPEDNKRKTIATIVDIYKNDEDYDVLITYEINNIIYESYLNSYSSSYYKGKEITIYYDINDPLKIMTDTDRFLTYVFCGIGLLFIAISSGIFILRKLNEKKIQNLKETGNIVNAKYLSTVINKYYTVNNRHPYNILCELDSSIDGNNHIFKSENIWFDPEKIIKERNIKTFMVYYNPNNLRQYYIDIDILFDSNIF